MFGAQLHLTRVPKEEVFSSSGDRARATQDAQQRPPRLGWMHAAAESLFAVFFPSDCRLCGKPLDNLSALPVCQGCIDRMMPLVGPRCVLCGERLVSSYQMSMGDA